MNRFNGRTTVLPSYDKEKNCFREYLYTKKDVPINKIKEREEKFIEKSTESYTGNSSKL